MKLDARWTDGMSAKEKEDLYLVFGNRPFYLQKLKDIVNKRFKEVDDIETTVKSYENPNWAELQAHRNGFKQALKEIQKLLSFLN